MSRERGGGGREWVKREGEGEEGGREGGGRERGRNLTFHVPILQWSRTRIN